MTAVWMRMRAELRTRWRAWLTLSLLVALFFGPALSAFAGARRTNSVYNRFLSKQRAWDVMLGDASIYAPILWKPDFPALERLPYVQDSVRVVYGDFLGLSFAGDASGKYGVELNRAKIVEGRLPRVDRPDEIAVTVFQNIPSADPVYVANHRALAAAKPGSIVVLHEPCSQPTPGCVGPGHTLSVVGRIVSPFDFQPNEFDAFSLVSPAFIDQVRRNPGPVQYLLPAIALRFQHPSDIAKFDRDLKTLTKGKAIVPFRQEVNARAVNGSARLQGMAVGLLAGFAGLTAILLMAQMLSRQTVLESGEHATLQALGMSRWQTFALGIFRAAAITAIGAALAGLAAWLSSDLFPFGVFRYAEPNPGLRFDALPMVLAPLAVVAIGVIAISIPAWRSASRPAETTGSQPSRVAGAMARAGVPSTAVAGVRLALERGRGRSAVPVRSTITIVTLGVASMIAALTVSSSIAHLLETPALYGKTWDKVINFNDGRDMTQGAVDALAQQPEIEALALADTGAPFIVDGRRVGGPTIHNVKGSLFPAVLEGRAPAGPNEINLGTKTLSALGKKVDPAHPQTVRLGIEGLEGTIEVKIVGSAAIPPVNNYARFGEGLVASELTIASILPSGEQPPQPTDTIARFRAGSDADAVVARVAKKFPGLHVGDEFARRPSDVVDFGRVKGMPLILSGVLGLIGALSLAHALISAIRRRRRDLAILKTMGFVRGQVRRAVAWQSSTLIVVAVVIGIPLGVIGGRALWNVIANGVGVVPRSKVPLATVLLVIPGALLLANLLAMLPARTAARTKPALVLRTE